VFLADGNALTLSNRRLLQFAELARSAFPGRGLFGFVDVFTGEKKSTEDWNELRLAGLRRVYVGVETGSDDLLGWLNKPGGSEDAREFVERLKTAGLHVSLIFMVGIGGKRFAAEHTRQTLTWWADRRSTPKTWSTCRRSGWRTGRPTPSGPHKPGLSLSTMPQPRPSTPS
jgi:radical SAM superfamily enzyme YgiQ (UPF0313 family)